jgi:hypothetical protein
MATQYGELMSILLHTRERCASEAEFRTYLLESARKLANDLAAFGVEVSVRPASVRSARSGRDWNHLKIGCE